MLTRSRLRFRVAAAGLGGALILATAACGNTASNDAAGAGTASTAAVGGAAPAGVFKTVTGAEIDIASYRGKPTLLWFVAAGCSSCTASIPALAGHLDELRADGVDVAVIDLYGDLGSGPKAAGSLRSLGQHLVGSRFDDSAWTWGISSRDLSFRYDQSGEPDVYYLVDRSGNITYKNTVPVSTMTELLQHAHQSATA